MRTISKEFFTVVTAVGTRKMLQAVHEGRKVDIVEFAVGDGNGEKTTPSVEAIALENEVWRGKVKDCRISEESENILVVESIIPAEAGGFTVREMGVFDAEGDMIAVCNTPDTAKVRIVDGVLSELWLKMEIILTNTESVNLTVAPNVMMASKADLEKVKVSLEEKIDNINVTAAFDAKIIIAAFKKVYGLDGGGSGEDPTAMTPGQVAEALATEWDGEASPDPAAMTPGQVAEALATEWDGGTSPDPSAMTAEQVAGAIK